MERPLWALPGGAARGWIQGLRGRIQGLTGWIQGLREWIQGSMERPLWALPGRPQGADSRPQVVDSRPQGADSRPQGVALACVTLHALAAARTGSGTEGAVYGNERDAVSVLGRVGPVGRTCATGDGEVVGVDAVCDPLLVAVHDVVVAHVLGGALDVGHIGASARLGDAQADDLLPRQALADDLVSQGLVLGHSEVDHGGEADAEAAHHGPSHTTASAGSLVAVDELVEVVVPMEGAR
eukprot:1177856-Prorocentrum_minimum.AAC.1